MAIHINEHTAPKITIARSFFLTDTLWYLCELRSSSVIFGYLKVKYQFRLPNIKGMITVQKKKNKRKADEKIDLNIAEKVSIAIPPVIWLWL